MIVEAQYRRQDSESYDDYSWRVCSNKELGIYDLTWDEVGEILNDQLDESYTSSRWRKNHRLMQKGYDRKEREGLDSEEIIDKIEVKKLELYKQQVKTRDQLREFRTDLRNEARLEHLKDLFIECAEIVSREYPLTLETKPVKIGNRVAILGISDWHVGEIVDNFMNTYNINVFHERMGKLTAYVIEYCKTMKVSVLKVLNLGDLISGNIHISSRVNSEQSIIEQTFIVTEALAGMLLKFAKELEEVEFYSVLDNHSRVNPNKTEHIEKESFARFIPWYLEPRLKEIDNIKIIENRINDVVEYDIGMFNIFDEKALFTHGHNDRIPSMIPNLTLMTRVFPVAVFTGHLHRNFEDEVHSIDLIMSPSGIGNGEYAKGIRKSSMPRQKLTVYEDNDGKVERVSTFFINL